MIRSQSKFLPIGSVLDRYLGSGFLRMFLASLLVITSLFLIVDFFDRVSTFLESGAPVWTVVRYFFYRAPLSISRMTGFATLFSTLFCLSILARTQEITAMRSSGISVQRLALPLLLLSLLICLGTFFWNETLVPIFSYRSDVIYRTEIKNKQKQSLLGTSDIWMRAENSFIRIDNFDPRTGSLKGVTILRLNRDFSLRGFVEIPVANWNGRKWEDRDAVEWQILPDGKLKSESVKVSLPITETPEELKLLARDTEEFGFFDLQKQIADMKSKGIDATAYEVDLQSKLALPIISPLMVLLAIPFALKKRVNAGLALSFGAAMIIGFGYWVLSAFCISLGHSGALPPWTAAWLPNGVFTLIGLFFFFAEE
jgi:lipopolysaccharide export system permease protein